MPNVLDVTFPERKTSGKGMGLAAGNSPFASAAWNMTVAESGPHSAEFLSSRNRRPPTSDEEVGSSVQMMDQQGFESDGRGS